MRVVIHRADLDSAPAQELLGRLDSELSERSPEEGANHFTLDPSDVTPGQAQHARVVEQLGARFPEAAAMLAAPPMNESRMLATGIWGSAIATEEGTTASDHYGVYVDLDLKPLAVIPE